MLKKVLLGLGLVIAAIVVIEVLALLVMKSSVSRYSSYWKTLAAESSQTGDFVYVALGDSTAQGIGATSAARGYVGLIAARLERETGRKVRVINLSVTGAKVADVLQKQLPEFKSYGITPDLVTMEIGANDLLTYDAASFRSDYEQVLSRLPTAKTVVSDMPFFGGRVDAKGNDVVASKVIATLTAKYNIPVAPLYRSLHDRHSLRIYAADYFHPSNYGYTIWYDAFWPEVAARLQVWRAVNQLENRQFYR